MTSHSDGGATDNDGAVVVGTVATAGGGVGAAADDTVIDGTVADIGTVKKQNFHTGPPLTHCGGRLDPVSRTKNSAQPTEFNAIGDAADKVRFAQSSSLDTGSSPVWSAVVDANAADNDHAAVTGTVATVGGGVSDGAIATAGTVVTVTVGDGVGNGAVAAADDTVIDGAAADTGTVKKQNFHTGLDPVSRTNNSAQPTEFNTVDNGHGDGVAAAAVTSRR